MEKCSKCGKGELFIRKGVNGLFYCGFHFNIYLDELREINEIERMRMLELENSRAQEIQ